MTATVLHIVEPGLLTTVQDLGRRGFQRYGIPVCGALDPVSLRIANILVGNPEGHAGLEMTAFGPTVGFEAESVIAVTGADFHPTLDGEPIQQWESVRVPAGSELRFASPSDGLRAYLAVAGGIDVPPVMNSRSTDLKGAFGGLDGRPLRAGDAVRTGASAHPESRSPRRLPMGISPEPTRDQEFQIRVVLGPQERLFAETGIAVMLTSEYTVSADTDRMGCRLDGPEIEHVSGPDIVSDGSALGSVQVPGTGTPIVLLSDRGTTGGYSKIATVIGPDIGLLAQAMPGARIRFVSVSVQEAHDILLEQEQMIREIKTHVGIDLTGTISILSDGTDVPVRAADGSPIALPGAQASRKSTRTVTATIDGQTFEVEIEVSAP